MIVAHLDWVGDSSLGGWGADLTNSQTRVTVRAYRNGGVIASSECAIPRDDLASINGGLCGYQLELSPADMQNILLEIALGDRSLDIYAESVLERTRVVLVKEAREQVLSTNRLMQRPGYEDFDKVVSRSDGRLYVNNDSNAHAQHIFDGVSLAPEVTAYWTGLIEACHRASRRKNFTFVFCIVAAKEVVETAADGRKPSPDRPALSMLRSLDNSTRANVLYTGVLLKLKCQGEYKFLSNDTHMNGLGTFLTYCAIAERLGIPQDLQLDRESVYFHHVLFEGDLAKVVPQARNRPGFEARVADSLSTKHDIDVRKTLYRNEHVPKRTTAIFGSSTAGMIAPLLAEAASELTFHRDLYLDINLIESGTLDHLVVIVPERYLPRVHRTSLPVGALQVWKEPMREQ